jgi:Bacterial TniB protein
LAADVVLETHDTVALTRQTRIIMARNMAKTATARRGLAMSGSSGLGKSTAALLIGKRHEKAMRKKTGRHDDTSYAPVVYAVVPPGTTPKMMMLAFANFLGLVSPNRATAQDLTERVVGVMRHLGTSLVICDEIHNLRTNHQAGSEAASALKVFSERLDATFLYAGIDLLQSDLLSGHMGRQIKGRITIHEMRPYSNGTRVQRDAWEELILGIESLLPLGRHPEGRWPRLPATSTTEPAGRSDRCVRCSAMPPSPQSSTARKRPIASCSTRFRPITQLRNSVPAHRSSKMGRQHRCAGPNVAAAVACAHPGLRR